LLTISLVGEAIAHAFVREGANVLIGDFVVDSGKRVESEIASKSYPGGGSGIFVEHNVTQRESWEDALELAKTRFGKLDIVVNNAGTTCKCFEELRYPTLNFEEA
jgi:NAD(P)-dependent dehydrogenase (short-subunit alcohol dehydrogenase family)